MYSVLSHTLYQYEKMGDFMNRNRLVIGTLVLTIANLLTKFMGFFYRVFMSNTIGAEGMGLYQLVFPLYLLAWSITSAGLTTTISHLTARENAQGQTGNIHKLLKQSISLALLLSFVVSFIFFFFANDIALLILHEERTTISLQLLSFAIPFMAVGSCLRGYFLGLQNTWVPAISQILEQVVRIAIVYFLMFYFLPMGLTYACTLAVLGVVLGEMVACIFAYITYFISRKRKPLTKATKQTFALYQMIVAMALPLSATRIATSLLSTIENILIPRQLELFGQNTADALSQYGELTGMILPLIFLPSACLMAASISLVPELSEASAVGHTSRIQKTVSVTFLFTFIIGIGSAAVFAVYPQEICYLVYGRQDLGSILFPLAFLCPFLYGQITSQGLLNGLGEQVFLFCNNLLMSLLTIAGIWFFMPQYGIPAFLWSWGIAMAFSLTATICRLYAKTGAYPHILNCFCKPLLAGLASGLLVRYIIQISEPSKVLFFLSLVAMGLLYLVFLCLLGCFSKENRELLLGKRA